MQPDQQPRAGHRLRTSTLSSRSAAGSRTGLLRIVWADTGRRTLKYHQVLDEVLDLADDERALLTVLLLRGPQAGKLRTRTDRLARVRRPRRGRVDAGGHGRAWPGAGAAPGRGDRDARWVHLLGDEPAAAAPAVEAGPVLDDAGRRSADARDERVRSSYDAVATAYADSLLTAA